MNSGYPHACRKCDHAVLQKLFLKHLYCKHLYKILTQLSAIRKKNLSVASFNKTFPCELKLLLRNHFKTFLAQKENKKAKKKVAS